MKNEKNKVLILCTGNSCRSQMAEAIINANPKGKWRAYSAGTKPANFVHPKAIQVLREIGIEHNGRSKNAEEFREADFDLVITVCDAAAEDCPLWLGKGKMVHHSYPDPAEAIGTEKEILAGFRSIRDSLVVEIPRILTQHESKLD